MLSRKPAAGNALDHPRSGPRRRHLQIDRARALPGLCAAIVDYPNLFYPYLKKENESGDPIPNQNSVTFAKYQQHTRSRASTYKETFTANARNRVRRGNVSRDKPGLVSRAEKIVGLANVAASCERYIQHENEPQAGEEKNYSGTAGNVHGGIVLQHSLRREDPSHPNHGRRAVSRQLAA